MIESFDLLQIQAVAQKVLTQYSAYNKYALYGDLGAGKTTFTSAMCQLLGVTEIASSPTFAIIQEYQGFYNNKNITICHTDWYRLKTYDDLQNAGVLEYLDNPDIFCFIEWASIVPSAITKNVLPIYLDVISENTRQIKINI